MNRPMDGPRVDETCSDEELSVLILAVLVSIAMDVLYLWQVHS